MIELDQRALFAVINDVDDSLFNMGITIGKIYTDMGLPVDMALDKLSYDKDQKIAILAGAQNWLVEHRRNSGATEKAIERQRETNVKTMNAFIKNGESGIY